VVEVDTESSQVTIKTRRPEALMARANEHSFDFLIAQNCTSPYSYALFMNETIEPLCRDDTTVQCENLFNRNHENNIDDSFCERPNSDYALGCCDCGNGGYIELVANGAYGANSSSTDLSEEISSDVDMNLDETWSLTGWISGTSNSFDITMRCDKEKAHCYGIGVRNGYLAWITQPRPSGRRLLQATEKANRISTGPVNSGSRMLISVVYGGGVIQTLVNAVPENVTNTAVYQGDADFTTTSIGGSGEFDIEGLQYYHGAISNNMIDLRYEAENDITTTEEPEESESRLEQGIGAAQDGLDFLLDTWYLVFVTFLMVPYSFLYNKCKGKIGPPELGTVFLFAFMMADTFLDLLFIARVFRAEQWEQGTALDVFPVSIETYCTWGCVIAYGVPVVVNAFVVIPCMVDTPFSSHRMSSFFYLLFSGGNLAALSIFGSAFMADFDMFTFLRFDYSQNLTRRNYFKLVADIALLFIQYMFLLDQEIDFSEYGDVVVISLATTFLSLCYVFYKLVRRFCYPKNVARFDFEVYPHISKPRLRERMANKHMSRNYLDGGQSREDDDYVFMENLLIPIEGGRWLPVQFLEKKQDGMCEVRVLDCPLAQSLDTAGTTQHVPISKLREVEEVQKNLTAHIWLEKHGIGMEGIVFVHGDLRRLSWDWNWKEIEDAVEHGIMVAYEDHFVAIHPGRTKMQPFTDRMMEEFENLVGSTWEVDESWVAVRDAWGQWRGQSQSEFDLQEKEFRKVWEFLRHETSNRLNRTRMGLILSGKVEVTDPTILKFVRQLASHTKLVMDDADRMAIVVADEEEFPSYQPTKGGMSVRSSEGDLQEIGEYSLESEEYKDEGPAVTSSPRQAAMSVPNQIVIKDEPGIELTSYNSDGGDHIPDGGGIPEHGEMQQRRSPEYGTNANDSKTPPDFSKRVFQSDVKVAPPAVPEHIRVSQESAYIIVRIPPKPPQQPHAARGIE